MKKKQKRQWLYGMAFCMGASICITGCGSKALKDKDSQKPANVEAQAFDTQKEKTVTPLTKEQKVEDFEYLCQLMIDNYAFLEVNKEKTGIDWEANHDEYKQRVEATNTDQEFYDVLDSIVSDLHNDHTCMVDRDYLLEQASIYYNRIMDDKSWENMVFEECCKPEVLARYGWTQQDYKDAKEEYYGGDYTVDNAVVGDLVDGKIACITIPELINLEQTEKDEKLIKPYLNKIKDYQALVIDLRNNGGGDSRYYSDFLYPLVMDKELEADQYVFFKKGSVVQRYVDYIKNYGYEFMPVNSETLSKFPNLPSYVADKFVNYYMIDEEIAPVKDSIHFKGHIYLLTDINTYSSAGLMVNFAKYSGMGKSVGQATGGDVLGLDPILSALPNSGYVVRYSKDYGTTVTGMCAEQYGIAPDYPVDDVTQTMDIKTDKCYQKVLELENIK